jgi:4-amino-4-deoxy-L-arabinose transferase-like glycosyltransferase
MRPVSPGKISEQRLSTPITTDEPPVTSRHASRLLTCLLLALIILLFAVVRWRLRDIPLERDEGEYAYAGQLMLQGVAPYAHLYSMKLPGTFAAYAVILAIFGQSASGIHLGLLVVNAATILLIYFIAQRLLGSVGGLVAAASYGLLSTSPAVIGFAGHATHFVVLAAMAGTLVLLVALERQRLWLVFASGLLLGTAFLMKQPGGMFAVFGGIYLAYRQRRILGRAWHDVLKTVGAFLVGAVLPFALTCLAMVAAGAFRPFWFWTFSYSRQYATTIGLRDGWELLKLMLPPVVAPCFAIWVVALVGLAVLIWSGRTGARQVFLLTLLICSAIAVCAGFYFRAHYFILLLPAVALLAALAVDRATELFQRGRSSTKWRFVPAAIFLAAFALSLYSQRTYLFDMDPLAASRSVYGDNPFPEALEAAEYLRSSAPPQARIAVLGSEPEIYFYAQRPAATGYVYTYGLMEDQPYALDMQKQMIAEIESAQPEYIAFVNVPASFGRLPTSQTLIFEWMDRYLPAHYQLVRTWPVGTAPNSREFIKLFKKQ